MKEYIKNMIDNAQPHQIMIRPTENLECEQQSSSGNNDDKPEENENEEPEENENEDEDVEINNIDNSNTCSSALTIMDWAL